MGTALLFLLLLALCGFIAYIGDLLGRRLGKKRLTVFGLRPKHTAILLTIVTGVLIALVTFGAAVVMVPGFRQVVTEGEHLAAQNEQLRAANSQQQMLNERLDTASRRIRAQNTRLQEENKTLGAAKTQLTTTNGQLTVERNKLERARQDLLTRNQELRGSNEQLAGQNTRLAAENTRLTGDAERLRKQQERLGREVRRLQAQIDPLRETARAYQEEQFLFRRGREISRRVLPATPELDVLREILRALMDEAERNARAEVERLYGDAQQQNSVTLVGEHYPGIRAPEPQLSRWAESRALAIRGKYGGQPLLIRVVATENAVPGRPVRMRLEVLPNEVRLPAGRELATKILNGMNPRGLILKDLLFFLAGSVSKQARQLGLKQEETVLGASFGELSWDQILDVVDQVRQIGGPARVTARTRQETRVAGPLNLDLEVRAVDGSRVSER